MLKVGLTGGLGSGKSTACAILSKNEYNLLADDTTPISRDGKVGNFPNSISVKEPSFQKISNIRFVFNQVRHRGYRV